MSRNVGTSIVRKEMYIVNDCEDPENKRNVQTQKKTEKRNGLHRLIE